MADHKGYVFIAPDGRFLAREILAGTERMYLTPLLDMAMLLPGTDLFRSDSENWEFITMYLRGIGFRRNFLEAFTPVPAKSFQRIEIGAD